MTLFLKKLAVLAVFTALLAGMLFSCDFEIDETAGVTPLIRDDPRVEVIHHT